MSQPTCRSACSSLRCSVCVSCFLLRVDELLRQGVGGLEMLGAVVFIEKPPELLRKPRSIWRGAVVLGFFWPILLCLLWVF